MNLAYHVVVFDRATDALWTVLGLSAAYRVQTGGGTFAGEAHIQYQAEPLLGDSVTVTLLILGADAKHMHLVHEMYRGSDVVAQAELMLLHVDLATRRVTPFRGEAAANIAAAAAHGHLHYPIWAGRRLAMPSRAL